jgi:hypothetical protein
VHVVIILKFPGWSALLLAAMAASGVPIWYAYRCGLLLATGEEGAWQFGLACAVLAAYSAAIPSLAVGAWKRGRAGSALLGCVTSACLLGVSIYGTATVELMQRAAQASERDGQEQQLRDLRAEVKAAQDRIADLGVHRSAAQIEAEMKAEQQSARWTATDGCTRATTAESRAYCAMHARHFGELAGAVETDRHLAGIERLRRQIKDVLASRKSSMADFEVALIARILKANKDSVELIRAVGRAIAIDLVGVAFLTLVWANHPETGTSGGSRSLRTARRWWRRRQRQDAKADSTFGADMTSAKEAHSSMGDFPPLSPDRPRTPPTRPPRKGAASIPSAQVLTFPRAPLPNASNDAKSGDRDNCGEGGHQAPHHVVGATAIAMIPPRIEDPVHRPSTSAGDNLSEHELETSGSILPAFNRERLESIEGASASASDICAALQVWCAKRECNVPSQKRLGLYLANLGFQKWKSNGKMYYQDVRLKGV